MAYIRLSPWSDLLTMRQAVDRMVDDNLARGRGPEGRRDVFVPAADAWEDADRLVLELALPGCRPDAVDVTYEQDHLTVSGNIPPRDEGRTWVMAERPRGRFERRFALNLPVDAGAAEASFAHGVLRLDLPKREEVRPHKIEVKTSKK